MDKAPPPETCALEFCPILFLWFYFKEKHRDGFKEEGRRSPAAALSPSQKQKCFTLTSHCMWSNCSQTQRPPSVISHSWLWCRRSETWTPAERRQTRHASSAETAPFQTRLLGERGKRICPPPDRTGPLLNNSDNRRHHHHTAPPPWFRDRGAVNESLSCGLMRINMARWGSNVAKISRPLGTGLKMTGSKAPGPPQGSAGGVLEVGMLGVISCYPERPDPSREGETDGDTFAPKPYLL